MDLKQELSKIVGVWIGTYTHLKPTGEQIDCFASRQETRIENDDWYERIIYSWADGRRQVLDFRARFENGRMVFDDPNFHGESFMPTRGIFVFPYFWKDKLETRIVEIIVFNDVQKRSRLWQTFTNSELTKLTVIIEQKTEGTPEIWY